MSLWRPTWLLTARAIIQFPRLPAVMVFSMVPPLVQFLIFGALFGNLPDQIQKASQFDKTIELMPTSNYYEYIAPAIVFFTCMIGIANAGVALVNDFENGYFNKIVLSPISAWSILLGRLLSDGMRVYVQSGLLLLLAISFRAHVETGVPGAFLMLLLGTLFAIFSVGVLVTNVAIKSKNAQAVQAIFPVFFILIFLTTSFIPESNIKNETIKNIIHGNPAQYVVKAMQSLMFTGYVAEDLWKALAIIGAFIVVGVPLTALNFRKSVYR